MSIAPDQWSNRYVPFVAHFALLFGLCWFVIQSAAQAIFAGDEWMCRG
jgi:hypothetical protein